MNNYEIFTYQLKQVELYLSKAIRLGVDRVFIIHGKGREGLRMLS